MSKGGPAPGPGWQFGPPPNAPPSYAQAVGGVSPSSPFVTNHAFTEGAGGQPIVTTVVPLGPQPTHTICPHCRAEVDTSTKTQPGIIAYISSIIICLLGCPLGCCLIPCCVDECMDVHHSCPSCKAYLGRFRR